MLLILNVSVSYASGSDTVSVIAVGTPRSISTGLKAEAVGGWFTLVTNRNTVLGLVKSQIEIASWIKN